MKSASAFWIPFIKTYAPLALSLGAWRIHVLYLVKKLRTEEKKLALELDRRAHLERQIQWMKSRHANELNEQIKKAQQDIATQVHTLSNRIQTHLAPLLDAPLPRSVRASIELSREWTDFLLETEETQRYLDSLAGPPGEERFEAVELNQLLWRTEARVGPLLRDLGQKIKLQTKLPLSYGVASHTQALTHLLVHLQLNAALLFSEPLEWNWEVSPSQFTLFLGKDAPEWLESLASSHAGTQLLQLAKLLGFTVSLDSGVLRLEPTWSELEIIATAPPAPVAPGLRRKRVLVADDNEVSQLVLARALERLGVEAELVADGREAVERLERKDFDLVLLDCHMPDMNGFEAARRIRALSRIPQVPIVALTGGEPEPPVLEMEAAGMSGYLPKPIRLEDLQAKLQQIG